MRWVESGDRIYSCTDVREPFSFASAAAKSVYEARMLRSQGIEKLGQQSGRSACVLGEYGLKYQFTSLYCLYIHVSIPQKK